MSVLISDFTLRMPGCYLSIAQQFKFATKKNELFQEKINIIM